jgi:hypothetical protein
MACNSLTSILKSCSNNQGGIYSVWINETDNVTGTTVSVSAHTITGISATTDFTTFEFNRNVGSVVIEPKIDLINGSTYFEAKISLGFHRREAAKSRALYVLGEAQRYLDIIFLDANGIYWYVDHAQLDGGTEETGVTKADGSKYTVTFKADMSTRPYAVDSTIIPALIS